ncbi:LysM peptidoglycan-binding domain-containing protein [Lactobacillus crispatus]|uniref:LysM peptidoglycan-binding domain-containing protein n=1 Tax=Lactobacillus crispatus TaxID=47770 RepID=UPI001C4DE8D4|nr:LysM domain-containing protein [Lactobacillus crispatus]MBW0437280.1 LysM peptidoglycan-binding domain-containing protein [Lactobacillus crispatus]MBW0443673.1 LysM peptidoglycan-binding domain-containing protein [Lactobacillus crispatus]MBW0455877.1 LysM peptidoglycan-binding domain-containing protein [Lactobacillus crispatus]
MATKKKQPTAYEKAKAAYDAYREKEKVANSDTVKAQTKAIHYEQESYSKPKSQKDKLIKQRNKWLKAYDSAKKRKSRYRRSADAAKSKLKKLQTVKDNRDKVADKIASHKKSHNNEGNCAIYRSDGHSTTVIFISPTDTESETSSVNITSWPVDKGSPRYSHARTASETKSIGGLITGQDRAEANAKYKQLEYWRDHHTELTYEGDFKKTNLLISELGQSFTDLRDNLKVTISFSYVRAAEATHSTGNNSKVKKSKSSKTTAGSRNKRYTAITIKPGDTLLGLSRKYGQSVAWLQKVNKIKNPNLIYAGRTLYLSKKQQDIKKKVRVK